MRIIYIIIAILLGVNNVFIRFKVSGISYDRLLEFLLFFFFFKSYLEEVKTNPFFRKWNNFLLVFAILQLLINFKMAIAGDMTFESVYTIFIRCLSFLVFSYLFLLIAKQGVKYVNVVVWCHLIICIFAFLQHPLSPISSQMLEVKRFLYSNVEAEHILGSLETEETYISGGFSDRFRLAGPFASSIAFSYFALSSFVINLYLYLRYKRKFYLIVLAALFIASILTQTRSLLLAELVLVFGFLFFVPSPKSALYKFGLISAVLVGTIFLFTSKSLIENSNSRLTKISSEGEGDSRPLLWITGIRTVVEHPLGVTDEDYNEVRKEMYYLTGRRAVLMLSAHHGLINIGFHYSFIGYIVFALLLLFLLREISTLEPRYSVFFKMVFVAYLIHTSFHNNFILNSDYDFLMVLMLIWIDKFHHREIEVHNSNTAINSIKSPELK